MTILLHSALRAVFPPQCLTCGALVESRGGLCAECWRGTPFVLGLVCDLCGVPLPGTADGQAVHCDDCRAADRPWVQGRTVMLYAGGARRIVLGLKHGDRLDMVPTLGEWMAARARPLMTEGLIVAPIPLHWRRLFRRRYNQSAVLGRAMAKILGLPFHPDLLRRPAATHSQDGLGHAARAANLAGAIEANGKRAALLAGRPVLLVDDVMTSGATLDAATRACLAAGLGPVRVMTLARVAKDA